MGRCEGCGNQYDKSFKIIDSNNTQHIFDSFECAINMMAPQCLHCGCKVLGHGVEASGRIYCCEHCSRASGESKAVG